MKVHQNYSLVLKTVLGIDTKEEVSSADPGPRSTAETTQVPEIDLLLGKVKDLKRPNLTGIEVPVYVNSPKGARFKLGNVSHVSEVCLRVNQAP